LNDHDRALKTERVFGCREGFDHRLRSIGGAETRTPPRNVRAGVCP
jgi:hypothetical protein